MVKQGRNILKGDEKMSLMGEYCEYLLKFEKEVKENLEYGDVVRDILKIEDVLENRIIEENGIFKDKVYILKELMVKYKAKEDFEELTAFNSYCEELRKYEENKRYINAEANLNDPSKVDEVLKELELWIAKYLGNKYLKNRTGQIIKSEFDKARNLQELQQENKNEIMRMMREINEIKDQKAEGN